MLWSDRRERKELRLGDLLCGSSGGAACGDEIDLRLRYIPLLLEAVYVSEALYKLTDSARDAQ